MCVKKLIAQLFKLPEADFFFLNSKTVKTMFFFFTLKILYFAYKQLFIKHLRVFLSISCS